MVITAITSDAQSHEKSGSAPRAPAQSLESAAPKASTADTATKVTLTENLLTDAEHAELYLRVNVNHRVNPMLQGAAAHRQPLEVGSLIAHNGCAFSLISNQPAPSRPDTETPQSADRR